MTQIARDIGAAGRSLRVASVLRVTIGIARILGNRNRIAIQVHHRRGLDAQRRVDLLIGVGSRRNHCRQERCDENRRNSDPHRAP